MTISHVVALEKRIKYHAKHRKTSTVVDTLEHLFGAFATSLWP